MDLHGNAALSWSGRRELARRVVVRVNTDKEIRAQVAAAAAANGLIKIAAGRNTREFLDEIAGFPNAAHDDCVDALTGAHKYLARYANRKPATIHNPNNVKLVRRTPRPRSAAQALAAHEQEQRQMHWVAEQIGIPYHPGI